MSGTFLDQSGAVLSGLNLELKSGQNVFRNVRTDNLGQYDFGEIPAGEYKLRVKYADDAFCAPIVRCGKECVVDPRLKVNPKHNVVVY